MGLAASQARLLTLTSRMSDLEFAGQRKSNEKQRLSVESSQIATDYTKALNQKTVQFLDGNSKTSDVTVNTLLRCGTNSDSADKQRLITNSAGQVLVTPELASAYEKSGSVDDFLVAEGVESGTTVTLNAGYTNSDYEAQKALVEKSSVALKSAYSDEATAESQYDQYIDYGSSHYTDGTEVSSASSSAVSSASTGAAASVSTADLNALKSVYENLGCSSLDCDKIMENIGQWETQEEASPDSSAINSEFTKAASFAKTTFSAVQGLATSLTDKSTFANLISNIKGFNVANIDALNTGSNASDVYYVYSQAYGIINDVKQTYESLAGNENSGSNSTTSTSTSTKALFNTTSTYATHLAELKEVFDEMSAKTSSAEEDYSALTETLSNMGTETSVSATNSSSVDKTYYTRLYDEMSSKGYFTTESANYNNTDWLS